jgi:formylglycine-generating enzyme required for sulfatase activity
MKQLLHKARQIVKRWGKPAKFAAQVVLNIVVPGPVSAVVGKVLDCALEAVGLPEGTGEQALDAALDALQQDDLERIEEMLDLLRDDLQKVMDKLVPLEQLPEKAREALHAALAAEEQSRQAALRLQELGLQVSVMEEHMLKLVGGQRELLGLVKKLYQMQFDYLREEQAQRVAPQQLNERLARMETALCQLLAGQTEQVEVTLGRMRLDEPKSAALAAGLAVAQNIGGNMGAAAKNPAPESRVERIDSPVPIESMLFVPVLRGTFWMSENDHNAQKQVQIAHDFEIGVYPATQEQWQALMGNNPSWFSRNGGGAGEVKGISDGDLLQFPVECVSWDEVQEFLKKLNDKEKVSGWVYRSPTEAEWEYACRGGATSKEDCSFDFYFQQPTNKLSSHQANFDGHRPCGGATKGPYLERTTKVGSYQPNRLGIYDMHGNVWEWCEDSYDASHRVIRGGGWRNFAELCRAARRFGRGPGRHVNRYGFRLARSPSGR